MKIAGCDDCMTFVLKVCKMPAFDGAQDLSNTVMIKVCDTFSLRWQGKPIEKHTWIAIAGIIPFCQDDAILSSLSEVKRLFPKIDELTKLSKICRAASSFIKGTFLNEEFQDSRSANIAMQWGFQWLQNYIMFANVELADLTNNKLVGAKTSEVGFLQTCWRKLQIVDFAWKHYRSSAIHDPEVGKMLWEKFANPNVFISWATAPDFWKRDLSVAQVFLSGQKGVSHWTMTSFHEFCKKQLPSQAVVAYAEILFGLMCDQFDLECLAHVADHPDGGQSDFDGISRLMHGTGSGSSTNQLTTAWNKYLLATKVQAVPLHDDQSDGANSTQPLAAALSQCMAQDGGMDGGEQAQEQAEKKQLCDKLDADVDKMVRFHALPNLPTGPLGHYMGNVELIKILANCPFHTPTHLGPQEKAKVNAFLLSADLFPALLSATGKKDYRLSLAHNDKEPPEALKALLRFVLTARKPDDLIIICDGRFPKIRRFFDSELYKLGSFKELWVIYETPELGTDVRYPKKRLVHSNPNREAILIHSPKSKRKSTCQARHEFDRCGEKSSFDCTYTGVPLRSMSELPKIVPLDKRKMLGTEMEVPLSYPGDTNAPNVTEGVPFSWSESKAVKLWSHLFQDLQIDHIFDTTTGSSAAAIAAFYCNVQYDGICLSYVRQGRSPRPHTKTVKTNGRREGLPSMWWLVRVTFGPRGLYPLPPTVLW